MGFSIQRERQVKGNGCKPGREEYLWVYGRMRVGNKRPSRKIFVGPPTTENWEKAKRLVAEIEAGNFQFEKATEARPVRVARDFRFVAEKYLADIAVTGVARTTIKDRRLILSDGSWAMQALGNLPIQEIGKADVKKMINTMVRAGRKRGTVANHLDAVKAVFTHAEDEEWIDSTLPVDQARKWFKDKQDKTKKGRAGLSRKDIRPLAKDEYEALLDASRKLAQKKPQSKIDRKTKGLRYTEPFSREYIATLLLLDAGLRVAEIAGLRWGAIDFKNRSLKICASRPRGLSVEEFTKTGIDRQVEMSSRIIASLKRYYIECGRPAQSTMVLKKFSPGNYRNRHFKWACEVAGIGHRRPKDLRDTFASHLISHGIPIGYVAEQLGHTNPAVTGEHYARWVNEDKFKNPTRVLEGQVPADLLSLSEGEDVAVVAV